ncbi:MAG: GIY-YIG nuclease family protein [Flavobacteriales bacterium]|nr:GIY-YIG nuclease family protein [Flavobacteriales bacterium]
MKFYWVYFMANARNTTLYAGVTNDIERRVKEHKAHKDPRSFTARYNVEKLVWYEAHESIIAAIAREKQLKDWKREWKDALITKENPEWKDLAAEGNFG